MSIALEETYKERDFTSNKFLSKEFDNCSFIDCNFQEMHLSNLNFLECNFFNCNLTNTLWGGTTLNEVTFENCKLLGSNFSVCNPFMLRVRFRESNLSLALCTGLDLKNTDFDHCTLKNTDFTDALLTGANFDASNLMDATFKNTRLEKANFTTAYNYTIDPNNNHLKGARFGTLGISGLLAGLDIVIEK